MFCSVYDMGLSFYFPCPSRHTLNVPKMIFQSTQKLRSCIYLMSRSIHSLKDRIAISVFIVLLSFFFRSRNPCPFSYDSVLSHQFYHNLPITSIVFLSSRSPFYRCRSVFLFALFYRIFLFYRRPPSNNKAAFCVSQHKKRLFLVLFQEQRALRELIPAGPLRSRESARRSGRHRYPRGHPAACPSA